MTDRYIVVAEWKRDSLGQPVMQWGDPGFDDSAPQFYFAGPFETCKQTVETFTLPEAKRLVKKHNTFRRQSGYPEIKLVIVKLNTGQKGKA